MPTRINDESLLLSKYLANNSNKASEIEKTVNTTTSSNKTTSNGITSKYDLLELSYQTDPYVYNNYNASGQYESIPSLVDYLDDDSNSTSDLFSSTSNADALKLLGATGGSNSLLDFLEGGSGEDASNNYSSYFASLSQANSTRTQNLIKLAMEKLQGKEADTKLVDEAATVE
ncbi:MAG: hypothetical protein GXY34_12895 [Syntrophomonadaceae bacterium]|nr:hypothetical protein [Syntrophomonadaceae bacterium]